MKSVYPVGNWMLMLFHLKIAVPLQYDSDGMYSVSSSG